MSVQQVKANKQWLSKRKHVINKCSRKIIAESTIDARDVGKWAQSLDILEEWMMRKMYYNNKMGYQPSGDGQDVLKRMVEDLLADFWAQSYGGRFLWKIQRLEILRRRSRLRRCQLSLMLY